MTGQRDILQRLGDEQGEGSYDIVRETFPVFGEQLGTWSILVTDPPAIQEGMTWFFDN
jgi:hypothetical protein